MAWHSESKSDEAIYLRKPCRLPQDKQQFWPPALLGLDMLFYRQLFDRIEVDGLTVKGQVHVTLLRSMSVRLLDAMGLNGLTRPQNDFFGTDPHKEKVWFTWVDICKNVQHAGGHPTVKLSLAERIFMTLDMAESSGLAQITMFVMMALIFGNIGVSIIQSMPSAECPSILRTQDPHCGAKFQSFCMAVFSLEYIAKLVCSPFVRIELIDRAGWIDKAVRAYRLGLHEDVPAGPVQRVWLFLIAPVNLVDLISILPMWMALLVDGVLPPSSASFLRVLRVGRVFRILRTGRYLEMLQIMGVVIVQSMRSIMVLLVFVFIVVLLAGVILQQVETGDIFSTVPGASYWIGAHLINMKEVPSYKEPVTTVAGVTILSIVLILKAILWILPIGQMKTAYDEACKNSIKTAEMRSEVQYELTKPAWHPYAGLQESARAYLEFSEEGSSRPVGLASMPVPIVYTEPLDFEMVVPILQGFMRRFCGNVPALKVQITWNPHRKMRQDATPHPMGHLLVKPLQAEHFPRSSKGWSCCLSVPVGLHGDAAVASMRLTSAGGTAEPVFDGVWEFTVDWSLKHESMLEEERTISEVCKELSKQREAIMRQVAKLDGQAKHLEKLESQFRQLSDQQQQHRQQQQ